MNHIESSVYDTLKNLRSTDKLTELLCTHLNYEYSGSVVSQRGWKEHVKRPIRNLQLIGTHDDFQVIFCEIERLLLGAQRPIINQLLKNHPYCLLVFSDPTHENWHFVNAKYDENVKNRRLFRRIIIGPDERLHTAAQRISLLDVIHEKISALELQVIHDEAFEVEEVTRQFFDSYTRIFALLQREIAQRNPTYKSEASQQAQILLNRLIFLYFIQKKGWLDNNKTYLYEKFLSYYRNNPQDDSFYSDFLIRLFRVLSSQDLKFDDLGVVPFLNGGLFEVDPFYSKLPFSLKIGNTIFSQVFGDFLEHFNFTVREDTPLDVEVAIDPEMLGKIFENLILRLEKGEDLRKKTGSYYTPRAIVHFMCQESLKEYLCTESAIEASKTELLFRTIPADQLTHDEVKSLQHSFTVPQVRLLRSLITNAYVLDPAVGSGAFLVGMLHEMISIIKLLDVCEFGRDSIEKPNYDYELKRQLIETSLYGVDIQDQAVRICELRLWLSLIVDYERQTSEDVPPLPNLTYKIRCGDSLIEKLFDHNVQLDQFVSTDKGKQLIDEVKRDKEAYFLARDIQEKNRIELSTLAKQCELMQLLIKEKQKSLGVQSSLFGETAKEKKKRQEFEQTKKEYEHLILVLRNTHDKVKAMLKGKISAPAEDIPNLKSKLGISFIWKLDFAEVFKDKGGFDVVIANPPYVSFGLRDVGKAKREWADFVRTNYPNSAEYKLSTYAIFMDRGLQLVKEKGILSYITPDSFLVGRYFSKLRSFILRSHQIKEIVMFEKDFWRAGVVGRPVVSKIQRRSRVNVRSSHHCTATLCTALERLSRDALLSYSYDQRYFERVKHNRFRLFFSEKAMSYVRTIEEDSIPLGELARITTGVRSRIGQKEIISKNPKNKNWKKGIVSGSQVQALKVKWEGHYLNINKKILWAGGWDAKIVENSKLMIRQTSDSLIAGIDHDRLYHLNNVHSLSLKDPEVGMSLECLCAILNSRLMNRFYHLISLEKNRTMAQTDIETLETLPIKIPDKDIQNKIKQLICKGFSNNKLGSKIEEYINDIYGLSGELKDYLHKDALY